MFGSLERLVLGVALGGIGKASTIRSSKHIQPASWNSRVTCPDTDAGIRLGIIVQSRTYHHAAVEFIDCRHTSSEHAK